MTKSERKFMLSDVELAAALDLVSDPADLWQEGQPRWHCLKSKPGKDFAMAEWLKRRGAIDAFTPVQVSKRRVRGQSIRHVKRYLPSHVFVLFPGPVVWHRVLASPLVQDTIRLSVGKPAALEEVDLRLIRAMKDVDAAAVKQARIAATVRKGDRVRVMSGILQGMETEVREIRAGKARLQVRMFSAEIAAEIDVSGLHKLD